MIHLYEMILFGFNLPVVSSAMTSANKLECG